MLVAAILLGESRERPPCNATNIGRVWPDKDARGPCVQLEVCTYGSLRYKWRTLTVNISQLPKNRKHRGNCETRARTEPRDK